MAASAAVSASAIASGKGKARFAVAAGLLQQAALQPVEMEITVQRCGQRLDHVERGLRAPAIWRRRPPG